MTPEALDSNSPIRGIYRPKITTGLDVRARTCQAKLVAAIGCALVYTGATSLSIAPALSDHDFAVPTVCVCSGVPTDHCSCSAGCPVCRPPTLGCAYVPAACSCGAQSDPGLGSTRVVLHLLPQPVTLVRAPDPIGLREGPDDTPYSVPPEPPEKVPLSDAAVRS